MNNFCLVLWFEALLILNWVQGQRVNLAPVIQPVGNVPQAVSEALSRDTLIFSIQVTDPEGDDIIVMAESNTFSLVNNNIILKESIDRENEVNSVSIKITAEDSNGASTELTWVFAVLDVNDNAPHFSEPVYNKEISEDTQVEDDLFPIEVRDVDFENKPLSVHCFTDPGRGLSIDPCQFFGIQTETSNTRLWRGTLILKKMLNFEATEILQIGLSASDGLFNTTTSAEIKVINVQDQPPVFVSNDIKVIAHGSPMGSFVTTVKAVDGDSGPQRRAIQYSLISNFGNLFYMDRYSGNITTARIIDISDPLWLSSSISLTVKAQEVVDEDRGVLGVTEGLDQTTEQVVTVIVKDLVNDNHAVFDQNVYKVTVLESIADMAYIPQLQLIVTDDDYGEHGQFMLSFVNPEHNKMFRIFPDEGERSVKASLQVLDNFYLDFDSLHFNPIIELQVKATQKQPGANSQELSATATVLINVVDVNDNAPRFHPNLFVMSVLENTLSTRLLGTFTATDDDSIWFGDAGLRYFLRGPGAERFQLDPLTADLCVAQCQSPTGKGCLDYESRTKYDLQIFVEDNNGTHGLQTRRNLIINVIDENDNGPEFLGQPYIFKIKEGTTTFIPRKPITVHDADSEYNGNNRATLLLVKNPHNLFTIGFNGVLQATRPVWYEDTVNGSLLVQVDAINKHLSTSTSITIDVEDINNNSPIFHKDYVIEIPQNINNGEVIIQVNATDSDVGQNSEITYTLLNYQHLFYIGAQSGIIMRRQSHRLEVQIYSVLVRASDNGSPRTSATTTVTVVVKQANSFAPRLSPFSQTVTISSDVDVGVDIYQVKAEDPDEGAQLQYFLHSLISAWTSDGLVPGSGQASSPALFAIDQFSGSISVLNSLRGTSISGVQYSVLVRDVSATDQQEGIGTLTIYIDQTKIENLEFVNFLPRFTIAENSQLFPVVVRAIGGHVITYSLDNSQPKVKKHLFIDPNSGIVTVRQPFDYEMIETLDVSITVTNNGPHGFNISKTMVISIENVNDNWPQFSEPVYQAVVRENATAGHVLETVEAVDKDKGSFGVVRYDLVGDYEAFTIDSISGVISVKLPGVLDYERQVVHIVNVRAYDNPTATLQRNTFTSVTVSVVGVNDNPPAFPIKSVRLTLPSSLPVSTTVYLAQASDPDEHDILRYSFISGLGLYHIDSQTGAISTQKSLLIGPKEHSLVVMVKDLANHTDRMVILISVKTSQTRVHPRFQPNRQMVFVSMYENNPIGAVIYDANATDLQSSVQYSMLVDGKPVLSTLDCHIDRTTGLITAARSFDWEHKNIHQVIIRAQDGDTPEPRTAEVILMIQILDLPDSPPTFPQSSYTFWMWEGQLSCALSTDESLYIPSESPECAHIIPYDKDQTDKIYFHITDNVPKLLRISGNGAIYPKSLISRKNVLQINMMVFVSNDPARPNWNIGSNGSVAEVIVNIMKNPRLIQTCISVTSLIGTTVADIAKKSRISKVVTYTLQSQKLHLPGQAETQYSDLESCFTIDKTTGTVLTSKLFPSTFEGGRFDLSVEISDGQETMVVVIQVWMAGQDNLARLVFSRRTQLVGLEDVQRFLSQFSSLWWILDVAEHVDDRGIIDHTRSDVYLYGVNPSTMLLYGRYGLAEYQFVSVLLNYIQQGSIDANKIGLVDARGPYTGYVFIPSGGLIDGSASASAAGAWSVGLLAALVILLILLLLPLLCLCCTLCCTNRKNHKLLGSNGVLMSNALYNWRNSTSKHGKQSAYENDWTGNNLSYKSREADSHDVYQRDGERSATEKHQGANEMVRDNRTQIIDEEVIEQYQVVSKDSRATENAQLAGLYINKGHATENVQLAGQLAGLYINKEYEHFEDEGSCYSEEEYAVSYTSASEDESQIEVDQMPAITVTVNRPENPKDETGLYNTDLVQIHKRHHHRYHHHHHGRTCHHHHHRSEHHHRHHHCNRHRSRYHRHRGHSSVQTAELHVDVKNGKTMVLIPDGNSGFGLQAQQVEYEVQSSGDTMLGIEEHHSENLVVSNTVMETMDTSLPDGFTIELETEPNTKGFSVNNEEYTVVSTEHGLG